MAAAPRAALLLALLASTLAGRDRAVASVPVAVHVVGNHLVDATGATIQLRGVDRSGTEFACTGSSASGGWSILDQPSSVTEQQSIAAMIAWGVNSVRIPLNEDCWLGINGVTPIYSGSNYRSAIYNYVQLLHSYGLIAILDLHFNASGSQVSTNADGIGGGGQQVMADESHAPAFWTSVADTFLSDPGVIFDLYNEPTDISWSCWLSGGCTAPAEEGATGGWAVAGMQQLVDVVRATGATQPIMVGGLDWANDLSQWLAYEPIDPLSPPQLIASVHVYEGNTCGAPSCWNSEIAPVAARVPVVTGEFGPSSCDGAFVDQHLDWADDNGVSYLAWNWGSIDDGWNCASGPALLEHDDGTPDPYGAAVEAHYQAVATQSSPTSTTTPPTSSPSPTTTTQPFTSTTTSAPPVSTSTAPGVSVTSTTDARGHSNVGAPAASNHDPAVVRISITSPRSLSIIGRDPRARLGAPVEVSWSTGGRGHTAGIKVGRHHAFVWRTGRLVAARTVVRFSLHGALIETVIIADHDRRRSTAAESAPAGSR